MTAKFGEARRRAFLAALAASGNQTLAAEKAKVSRSWVQKNRTRDSAFRAAMERAIAEARVRVGRADGREPPRGWRFLAGEELVCKGTNGRRVQIARARLKQWTPRVEERFLAALSATCNVKAACAEVEMTAVGAYAHRKRWPAFARRWDEAVELGYMQIEAALIETGCNLLSGEMPAEPSPLRGMTTDHAIHLLHMQKHATRGIGKRPGLRAREPDIEDIRAEILRKVEVFDWMKERAAASSRGRPLKPSAAARR